MPTARLLVILGTLITVPGEAADQPVPAKDAAGRMTLPEGFRATLFAGEPDVVQPIAFTFDDRGRLWVVECYSYPKWIKQGPGKDRILIFEDSDGDGRFDTRKVFWDKGANLTGIQLGFGGVWLCATPNFVFVPDRDGDDAPDGPPEVLLDGWSLEAKHNVFNGLTWGPDGWLYGCHGITATSKVGSPSRPGTPEPERVPINCGVWRYHPTRRTFEVVAHGTTNPWGLDFDDYGQMFITNCVIHHLWHVVPGAHFQRMYGQDLNPHVYGLIGSCADHIHWGGGPWQESRGGQGKHDEPGGGHAHTGCMVYLGDNWPADYRNGVFMCNLHGSRINHDTLERRGSGYRARHAKDVLLANDPWFRGLAIHLGPDGGVYVSDWCDTGECHNYDVAHQTTGRIFKVVYGKGRPTEDLAKLSDAELVRRQLHANDWHVRHARRLLQERASAGRIGPETHEALRTILKEHRDVTRRLRALWALHVTGGLDESALLKLLDDADVDLRAWAMRLAVEECQASADLLKKLTVLASSDPSPFVRLHLASALQRVPVVQRWPVAEALVTHAEDAADPYLPFMLWYGVEPLIMADAERFAGLIAKSRVPVVREHVARRLAVQAPEKANLEGLVRRLGALNDPAERGDVLRGLHAALDGRRHVPMPESWPAVYRKLAPGLDADSRAKAVALAVLFGDVEVLATLRKTIRDPDAPNEDRHQALQALLAKRPPDLLPELQKLMAIPGLRGPAIRGLAAYADEKTPRLLLEHYGSFNADEKADAIHTLACRPSYASALLDAVEKGTVPRRDLSAFTARQILSLNDKIVSAKLTRAWGTVRPASEIKVEQLKRYKDLLTPDALREADVARGRTVFQRSCVSCHVLFGEGGRIGPELTGGQRDNLDYWLDNLIDPAAAVPRDYQATLLQTTDGRFITGVIVQENEQIVAVQTANEQIRLPKHEIADRRQSPLSLMPEGLLQTLTDEEVRDLIGYVRGPGKR